MSKFADALEKEADRLATQKSASKIRDEILSHLGKAELAMRSKEVYSLKIPLTTSNGPGSESVEIAIGATSGRASVYYTNYLGEKLELDAIVKPAHLREILRVLSP